jgi:hypothetical protein
MLAVRILLGLVATLLIGVGFVGAGLVTLYAMVLTGRLPRPVSLDWCVAVLLAGFLLQLLVML